MKKIIVLLLLFVGLISCDARHKDASELCNCYTQLHRAVALKKINLLGDSCAQLHVEIIDRLEKNKDDLHLFEQALLNCQ
jgi:hypothetical protein